MLIFQGENQRGLHELWLSPFGARETKEIKWPKTFENEPHADLVSKIEKVITGEGEDDIGMLLQKLSQQLEQRVVDKSIAIKEYATAKRFVSGLAYEAEL